VDRLVEGEQGNVQDRAEEAVILLLALALQDKYQERADAVTMPAEEQWAAVAEKSTGHLAVVQAYLSRDLWRRAYKAVEDKYGLYREDLELSLAFGELEDDQRMARTLSDGAKSTLEVNMRSMVPYQKQIDEVERARKEGRTKILIEPVPHVGTVTHELVHAYQHAGKMKDAPLWFREGMAAYAEPTESHVRTFVYKDKKVGRLDAEVPDEEAYGRGWLFWSWLHKRLKTPKLKEYVGRVVGGEDYQAAAAQMLGKTWEEILEAEEGASRAAAQLIEKQVRP
jgi:hypothetical protein